MKLSTAKGTRDFLPEDKIIRDSIIAVLKQHFELYGYNPLETPALELQDVLASKFTGGEEILKEMYTLTDQGGRKLGLRYDLTVPFARVIAMNPERKKPFKRYQIDRVWRDGPIKLGRYREFYQCDVDVVGIKDVLAEAELLAMAFQAFKALGLKTKITVNHRALLDGLCAKADIDKKDAPDVILSLDKLKKIGSKGVLKELKDKGFDGKPILDVLDRAPQNNLLGFLKKEFPGNAGVADLEKLLGYLEGLGVSVEIDLSLARGLAYYTGFIYEGYLVDSKITSSICAGGRYDKMIGDLLGSKEEYPAVGLSFGLDVLCDAMGGESKPSVTDLYVIPMGDVTKVLPVVQQLRASGVRVDVDALGRNVGKNMKFAKALGIPKVVVIGENELKSGKVTVKDMESGDDTEMTIRKLSGFCKSI